MREEGRISPGQFSVLLASLLIGTSTLLMPLGPAGRDAWISLIVATILGLGALKLWLALSLRLPGQTLVGTARHLLGRWLGSLVSLGYLWFFLHLTSLVIRNIGELYVTAIMPATPILVFAIVLVGLCAWTLSYGIEVLARCAQILLPWLVVTIMTLDFLAIITPNLAHPEQLQPILESGWLPVLRGGWASFAFPFGEAILLGMVFPLVNRLPQTARTSIWALGLIGALLTLTQIRNIVVLGPAEARRSVFTTYLVVREINLADFVQRLDALVIFVWTFGTYLKATLGYYALALGTAELLNLRDYRPLLVPLGIIIVSLSILVYDNIIQMLTFAFTEWPVYAPIFEVLIPALMLVVAAARGIGSKPAKDNR